MARPTSADVRAHVRNVHDETLAWQRQQGLSQIPSQHSHDQEEANLGKRLAKLLIRRTKALGTKPSGSILTQAEATLINSLQGVPSQGCAVSINRVDEVENSSSGGPHSAASCKLPSSVFVAASGKRNAADAIKQPRAQSMKRPRQMDPSSGDLHSAAESSANLAVEEAHSEKPAGLNTDSSGVPQPAASCHEPRSPMVFMKILEPIWAAEVADGQKMFECVANKTKWQNQFKQLSSGDLFIVVMKGRDKVNAVCEVASPAIVKETNRDVLKGKLQQSRHAALDAYLDGAESFDYVEFRHVFDCRFFLPVSSTAAFLERVGLAHPKSPPVGLLRPVVIDAQWHIRLREYMQQAVMRGSVDTLAASHQEVLTLEVTTAHYNAIISRRQGWEARAIFRNNNRGRGQSHDDKLATLGRHVILLSGRATGRIRIADTSLCRIAEVRRYTSAQEMVSELVADLPSARDYIKLYDTGFVRGCVAMRLELLKEGPAECLPEL